MADLHFVELSRREGTPAAEQIRLIVEAGGEDLLSGACRADAEDDRLGARPITARDNAVELARRHAEPAGAQMARDVELRLVHLTIDTDAEDHRRAQGAVRAAVSTGERATRQGADGG